MQNLKDRMIVYKDTARPNLGGPVVYWMSRDQRVQDNWALVYAQQEAIKAKVALHVVFALQNEFLNANQRIIEFMKNGLGLVAKELKSLNISFSLLLGDPNIQVPKFIHQQKATLLVTDFSPLKIKLEWQKRIAAAVPCPLHIVDAHNIIPPWIPSQKQEYAARTFRPKVFALIDRFLTDIPQITVHPNGKAIVTSDTILHAQRLDSTIDIFAPLKHTLNRYEDRNNPLAHATTKFSKALHFGHISAQRLALYVKTYPKSTARDSFFEQLIVRRELAENYCYYNENYDNTKGFPLWAIQTLRVHASDKREYLYTQEEFEHAKTHEHFWNAIQTDLIKNGYLNGYLRMYWAKKILEWTSNAEVAQQIAIYLNDKYQFDGRDPNGYTGIAWAIGGVHDRPWFNRPIFGTIRYMNESGAKRKFNVEEYIKSI